MNGAAGLITLFVNPPHLVAEVGRGGARVRGQRFRARTRDGEPAVLLGREQHVRELALEIRAPAVVAAAVEVQVVEIEPPQPVAEARHRALESRRGGRRGDGFDVGAGDLGVERPISGPGCRASRFRGCGQPVPAVKRIPAQFRSAAPRDTGGNPAPTCLARLQEQCGRETLRSGRAAYGRRLSTISFPPLRFSGGRGR